MGSVQPYETAAGKRYRVQYRTPDRRNTMKRGFRTKREAEQYLAVVEVSKMRGEWIDASRTRSTVRETAEAWYAAQLQVKATTRSGYLHSLEKHVLPTWGDFRVSEVSHSGIQAWVSALETTLGPSMLRQVYRVLSSILNFAVRDGRLSKNPAEGVQLPRLKKRRHGYLTHVQVRALADGCGPWSDLIYLLAYTGLRWGEMAALTPEAFDSKRGRIDIASSVTEVRGQLVWGSPKNHLRRSVPVPTLVITAVAPRAAAAKREATIFAGAGGGVVRAGNFRNRVFDAAVIACMKNDQTFPRITIHDLRHTAASLAVSAGANVKAIQRMLGHASAAMTLDVYADLFDDDLDAIADALDRQAAESFVVNS